MSSCTRCGGALPDAPARFASTCNNYRDCIDHLKDENERLRAFRETVYAHHPHLAASMEGRDDEPSKYVLREWHERETERLRAENAGLRQVIAGAARKRVEEQGPFGGDDATKG